jgi:hypothetical protein
VKQALRRAATFARRSPLLSLVWLGATFGLCPKASFAEDTIHAHRFAVGSGAALASSEWLNAQNSSRARTRFPLAPEIAFRVRLSGGIGQAPASDSRGNLIVAHGEPRVSKLDGRGRTLWSKRLESETICTPVLLSDGKILLLTHDGTTLVLEPTSGQPLFEGALPFADSRHRTLSIPTESGGALVASGSELVELDARARVVRQTHAPANVTSIAQLGRGLLAVSENGALSVAHESGDFELVGQLGGAVPDGAAVQNEQVFAVVDGHKLVTFDLQRGSASELASEPAVMLSGPPVLFTNRSVLIVADGGLLSLHAANGSEAFRVPLAEASHAYDPANRGLRPALAIGDAVGAVAAARSDNDSLIVTPDGKAQRLDGTSCLDPFRPTPSAFGLVFACRSGQLFGVSDKAR